MKSTLDPDWKPDIIPGGFCGHFTNNNEQRWDITSDASAAVIRIRKHKNGYWKDASGGIFRLSDMPVKFYDYNF
jgi:hypothetical protein